MRNQNETPCTVSFVRKSNTANPLVRVNRFDLMSLVQGEKSVIAEPANGKPNSNDEKLVFVDFVDDEYWQMTQLPQGLYANEFLELDPQSYDALLDFQLDYGSLKIYRADEFGIDGYSELWKLDLENVRIQSSFNCIEALHRHVKDDELIIAQTAESVSKFTSMLQYCFRRIIESRRTDSSGNMIPISNSEYIEVKDCFDFIVHIIESETHFMTAVLTPVSQLPTVILEESAPNHVSLTAALCIQLVNDLENQNDYRVCKWCGRLFNDSTARNILPKNLHKKRRGGSPYCSDKCQEDNNTARQNERKKASRH